VSTSHHSAPQHHRGRRIEDRLARRGGAVELLRAPAALFAVAARARGWLFDRGWMRAHRCGTPVISVGNIVAGGTGKTPFVAWLVRHLALRGVVAGLLSRGYRPGGRGAPDAATPNDEACMLAALLPDTPHVQDRDRVRGAATLARLGVDVIVLDDGFQHRRLARELDIVLIDATRPFGLAAPADRPGAQPVEAHLPRGLLREGPGALARADVIVLTRTDAVSSEQLARLEDELARFAKSRPIVRAIHAPCRLVALHADTRDLLPPDHDSLPRDPLPNDSPPNDSLAGGSAMSLAWLAGREVDLVSGIGNPAAFERTVRELGAILHEHRRYPDHHSFGPGDFAGLGARPVLVTAKDAARLAGAGQAASLPNAILEQLFALEVELEVVRGVELLDAALEQVALRSGGARDAKDEEATHHG